MIDCSCNYSCFNQVVIAVYSTVHLQYSCVYSALNSHMKCRVSHIHLSYLMLTQKHATFLSAQGMNLSHLHIVHGVLF